MKVFLVGIKGVGMTSLATLYKEWGHDVQGSDTEEEFFTDTILKNLDISVVPFDETLIQKNIDKVIYSSAYPKDHPQLKRAMELQIPVVTYGEELASIFNARRGVLVTGTHGKTTCTAMLGRVLEEAGLDPTVVCGGELLEWSRTARAGKGEWIVSEGDEYQAKILKFTPEIVLLTNIEYDHPDFYANEDEYRGVFRELIANMPESATVVAHESLRTFVEQATRARKIFFDGKNDTLKLAVLGEHNHANASGVLAVAKVLGVENELARKALSQFRGTRRRMEFYTQIEADCIVMDDYAHHPTEIRATLSALRARYPKRFIVAAFQPHTYSRTKVFLDDFANAFADADLVIILDIYASAREKDRSIAGEDLFKAVADKHSHVLFARTIEDAFEVAKKHLKSDSIFVSLGAGDVWRVSARLASPREAQ